MMDVLSVFGVAAGPSEGLSIRLKFSGRARSRGRASTFGEPTNPPWFVWWLAQTATSPEGGKADPNGRPYSIERRFVKRSKSGTRGNVSKLDQEVRMSWT